MSIITAKMLRIALYQLCTEAVISEYFSMLMIIYFSAGIGRTGTFIALDYLLRQAHSESHVDVYRTVIDMRYQRVNFVQTDVSGYGKLLLC